VTVESGALIPTVGRKCQHCFAELVDVTTTKISRGVPKVEYVDPLPDIAGTVAVTHTSNGYAGNVVAEKSKRAAMQAAGVKLYTVHADVCAKRGGSHRRP
jgi:hypothetical protein